MAWHFPVSPIAARQAVVVNHSPAALLGFTLAARKPNTIPRIEVRFCPPRLQTIEHSEQLTEYLIRAVLDVVKDFGDIG